MVEKILLLSMLYSGILVSLISVILWFNYKKKINEFITRDKITELNNFDYIYEVYKSKFNSNQIVDYVFITLDIDDFSSYNTLYATQLGDIILYKCGKQIKKILDRDEYASRIIADNFVLMLKKNKQINQRLEGLIGSIKQDLALVGKDIQISIGVYSLSEKDYDYIQSNTYSVLAKSQVKGNPEKSVSYFDEGVAKDFFTEQIMLNDLNRGLENKEFTLNFQVKYDIQRNEPIGAEVLVRWEHPSLGLIPPIKFIELFERKKCIHKLDLYVVEESCGYLTKFFNEYPDKKDYFRLAINLSGVSFMDEETMDIVENTVEKLEINPKNIEFELTESIFIDEENRPSIVKRINKLREQGYYIAMDDFGSGYSSLNLLKSITIDTLKLDKGFLDENTKKSNEIIKSIIDMAAKLDLKTVAEGIETKEQLEFLVKKGCNIGQGYLYSKPIPFNMFKQEYFKN